MKNKFFLLLILLTSFSIFNGCSLTKKRSSASSTQNQEIKKELNELDDKAVFLQQKEIDLKNLEDFLVEKQKSLKIQEEELEKEKIKINQEKKNYEETIKNIKEIKPLLLKFKADLNIFNKELQD